MAVNTNIEKQSGAKPDGIFIKYLVPVLFLSGSIFLLFYIFKPWGVLYGPGDIGSYDFFEYYFQKNLNWGIVPTLNFRTDMVFYPFGIDFLESSSSLEQHYFTYLLTKLFSDGPWMQMYCWFSCVSTGLLLFFILRRDVGRSKAWFVAFTASFLNVAALYKFPGHINLCTIHWAAASLAMDFIMARRFLENRLSLHFILVRILILFLSLGLDVGYIAGFGLTSFSITIIWMLFSLGRKGIPKFVREKYYEWRGEAKDHRLTVILPALGILSVCWLYLPILFQTTYMYMHSDSDPGFVFWANPLRIVLPWFPVVNANHPFFSSFFKDTFEMTGNMSPGWIIVIPGLVGLYFILRKRMREYLPFIVMVVLFLTYHPWNFTVLKILPWYGQVRVSGRFSLIFPVIMPLFALAAWDPFFSWIKRHSWVPFILIPVALLEIAGMYSILGSFNPMPEKEVSAYMDKVRGAPGSALLEWPFCIVGGNGVGTGELCPFCFKNESTYGLMRWHGKKLVNAYLSRLNKKDIKPLTEQGWPFIFQRLLGSQNTIPVGERTRFLNCFSKEEMEFFIQFLKTGDFAGIQLYRDLVGDDCADEIERNINSATASIRIPMAGRTEFIPKPSSWGPLVNEDEARNLKFITELQPGTYDLLQMSGLSGGWFEGVSGIFNGVPYGRPVRRINVNDSPQFYFYSRGPSQPVEFSLALLSGVDGQSYEILFNGKVVAEGILKYMTDEPISLPVSAVRGVNTLYIRFSSTPSFFRALAGFRAHHGDGAIFKVYDWHRHWTSHVRDIYGLFVEFKVKVGMP